MNKIQLFLCFLLFGLSVPAHAAVYTLGFENYVSGTNTYSQGTVPTGTTAATYTYTHTFPTDAGKITLNSEWSNWGALYPGYYPDPSWSWGGGFTISNISQENTDSPRIVNGKANTNYAYSGNQYAATASVTNYPTADYGITVSGANSSTSYAILYGSSERGTEGGTISFENPVGIQSLSYTNTLNALNILTYGDAFTQKASSDQWEAVIVQGIGSDGKLAGNQVLMLTDYLKESSIVTEWQTASFENVATKVYDAAYYGVEPENPDYQALKQNVEAGQTDEYLGNPILANFGNFEDVKELVFYFDGSDEGAYGFNFPVYAAIDDLILKYADAPQPTSSVPEPATWVLLVLGLALFGRWSNLRGRRF